MPSLENLKKQAKQYLRWHRERHYPVAAQIRNVRTEPRGARTLIVKDIDGNLLLFA